MSSKLSYPPYQPETKIRFRPIYGLCGVFLAISAGSLIAFSFDRSVAGQLGWVIVLGVVGFLISKTFEWLRRAMRLERTTSFERPLPWFGDWNAWIFSIFMGSSTMLKELDHGRSVALAVLIGVGGVLFMLAFMVSSSRLFSPSKSRASQPAGHRT